MFSDNEYATLLNKYNILLAKHDDYIKTTEQTFQKWNEKQEEWEITKGKIKKLCISILSKDSNEMRLGDEGYFWGKLPINELIDKSQISYVSYTTEKNGLIKRIMDLASERADEIENLKNQISQMVSSGEFKISDKGETEDKTVTKDSESATSHSSAIIVTESDEDAINEAENELLKKAVSKGSKSFSKKIKATGKSIPIIMADEKTNMLKNYKDEEEKKSYDDLKAIASRISEEGWEILKLIGQKGISRFSIIKAELQKIKPTILDSQIRVILSNLKTIQIINDSKVITPLTPQISMYSLSDVGASLYKFHFGKAPVLSEKDKIIAEHDNLQHGYTIIQLYELMLKKPDYYQNLSCYNKKNAITFKDTKATYSADIIYDENGKYRHFIEYERGTHTVSDFNAKLNKMLRVTRCFEFIVENQDTLQKVTNMVKKWAESKGPGVLKGIKAKICTANFFKDTIFKDETAQWQVEFDFNNSTEPIIKS